MPVASSPAPSTTRRPQNTTSIDQHPRALLLQFQRTHGNQYVQRLLARAAGATPATPLTVSATNDPAEAVADRLASALDSIWPADPAPHQGTPPATPRIHRHTEAADPGGPLDTETSLAIEAARHTASFPLTPATRTIMEPAMGATTLAHVRLHAGPQSADLCTAIQAAAFTHGHHIFFRRNLPDLNTQKGRHLLAHELAHITQLRPGAKIHRTYLDGDDDWIAATTHRQALTRSIRARSAALSRVDEAVQTVRGVYDTGFLPFLRAAIEMLEDRIEAWRATRPPARERMRGEAVRQLRLQAAALADDIDVWQGALYRAQLVKHRQQVANVEQWLNAGRNAQSLQLRNSVEWVRRKAKLYVLTETADVKYRAKILLRRQGKKLTNQDATYFPNPASGHGAIGDGPAEAHAYDTASALSNTTVLNKRINGWNSPGYIAVTEDGTVDQATFNQTLRHEVQHDADKHRGDKLSENLRAAELASQQGLQGAQAEHDFQYALRMYKTEYRAHSYQGGAPGFGAPNQPVVQARGRAWDRRQLAIFEHIRGDYPVVAAAVGGDQPTVQQRRFISEAFVYSNPDTEGFNKYSSVRIDDLYLALHAVRPGTSNPRDPAAKAVLWAAQLLSAADADYIVRNDGRQAPMLNNLIDERLSGAALAAFLATIR